MHARNVQRSLVYSVDGGQTDASDYLVDVSLAAARAALGLTLSELADRGGGISEYVSVWPGEHYRLLAGLVQELQPEIVIEIGTATGASALALLARLPPNGRVITFDVVPWADYPEVVLKPSDFADGRLSQETDDVTTPIGFGKHLDLFRSADMVFVDAAKDGVMEARLIDLFTQTKFIGEPLVVFDDIRLWNMLSVWSDIERPKLDLTTFGHWSGTGLVQWTR